MSDSLLSSVSLLLVAYGFLYTTQKDRIDAALADGDMPDDPDKRKATRRRATAARNVAAWLLIAALVMWALLLDQVEHEVAAALADHFDLGDYSTPDAVFFVAANTWVVIAVFAGSTFAKLQKRVRELG